MFKLLSIITIKWARNSILKKENFGVISEGFYVINQLHHIMTFELYLYVKLNTII